MPVSIRKTPSTGMVDAAERPPISALSRLALLHDEASETESLAALLNRSPWLAGALALAALATAAVAAPRTHTAPLIVWLLLIGGAVAALWRLHLRALGSPVERGTLAGFAQDLSAILIYAGFAWGAGVLLALPQDAGPALSAGFTGGVALIVAGALRMRHVSLRFLVPVTAMGAFAAAMVRADARAGTVAGIVMAGLVVAAASRLIERPQPCIPPHP
jgi:hypothetical protein